MDRVRGGVFSGAMVLAGISATLLSALLAIGIRQVTALHENRTVQVTMVPSSGQVAVPDATASPAASGAGKTPSAAPAYAPVPHSYVPPRAGSHTTNGSTGTTTGSRSSGGTVATTAPRPSSTGSTPPPAPSASPTPTKPGHSSGHGAANGAGNGNGHGHNH